MQNINLIRERQALKYLICVSIPIEDEPHGLKLETLL